MNHSSLDAFQLLVAFYLFYIAIKGSGTLYNFPQIPKSKQEKTRQTLRKLYAACGFVALIDAAASILQNSMYTVDYTEDTVKITQNVTIEALPFINYNLLSNISLICTFLIVLLLVGVIIYIQKQN